MPNRIFFIYYKTIIEKNSIFLPCQLFFLHFLCAKLAIYPHKKSGNTIKEKIYSIPLSSKMLSENSAESFKIMHESRLIFT